jgi:hypothetical protein
MPACRASAATSAASGKVHVPWARPDSGFTLLFEALLMTMVSAMPVRTVAKMVGEHDTRLWRVLHHYVDQARAHTDASAVTRVAIDETAARRGHDYITLFVDIDQARVLFATEGKDAGTVAAFADDLAAHGGHAAAVDEVCIDMSPAFIKGTAEHLPNAAVTFDKFHAVKIINDAVDQVRRAEQKGQSVLRGTRYIASSVVFVGSLAKVPRIRAADPWWRFLRSPASIYLFEGFCVCCWGGGHVGNVLALSTCSPPVSCRAYRL